MTSPNGTREDEYYWLRDDSRKRPDMLAYLAAENAYADALLSSSKALQDKLFAEITGRIKQDDSTVPYRLRGYWYYSRYETGKDYPVAARRVSEAVQTMRPPISSSSPRTMHMPRARRTRSGDSPSSSKLRATWAS